MTTHVATAWLKAPGIRIPLPLARLSLAICVASVSVVGCGRESEAPTLIDESNAPLLVPTDPRFADTWKFRAVFSKDNYEVFSNSSLHFDEDLDYQSTITGNEVNDRGGFIEGLRGEIADSWLESYTTLFEAVDDPANQDVCSPISEAPVAYRCEIDGQLGDEPTTWVYYYRRVPRDDGGSTELIISDHPAAPDFIVGEFIATDVAAAARTSLDTE